MTKTDKSIEESRLVVTKSWGEEGNGEWLLNEYEVFFWSDENVLIVERDGYTTVNALNATESHTLEGLIIC